MRRRVLVHTRRAAIWAAVLIVVAILPSWPSAASSPRDAAGGSAPAGPSAATERTRRGAERADGPKVQVDLVSEARSLAPGRTVWLGLRQRIAPGWHTYWINPGESGEPPRIDWTLPAGFAAADIAWPHPERIRSGPAMSYGYSREVVLPIAVTVPRDAVAGAAVRLAGRASWLVCEKECIPEEADVSLALPVVAGDPERDPAGAALIEGARRAVPAPSPWPASFTTTPETVTLSVAARGLDARRIQEVWFYPTRWGAIDDAAAQTARIERSGISIEVARGPLPEAVSAPIDGVLVVTERLDGGVARQAFEVRAEPGVGLAPLLRALGLALAGGLLLNLMPCVLPVLSVKALGLVRHAGDSPGEARGHALAYAAGVLAAFAALAGALIALRFAGEGIGWGFQLQSPVFVTLLAYLLFAMALSLSGALVIGGRWTGAGHALAARPGHSGSFFSGALAAVAATPCTAPFMGAAVGFALTQPWVTGLAVFEALGAGLALPYLVLALVPAWRRFLPRPGAWMRRLEQLLAFPLYASVAWLVWVLSQQAGPTGVAAALTGLVLIGLGAFVLEASREMAPGWRRAGAGAASALGLAAVAAAAIVGSAPSGPVAAAAGGAPGWPGAEGSPGAPGPTGTGALRTAASMPGGADLRIEPYSAARLAELRRQGRPVFVNVTAAWCITCLVNERVALRSSAVATAFAGKGVAVLRADWTNRDSAITDLLGSFGRSGVPLYLLYPPAAGGPDVLPQILSEGAVIEAVDKI